MNEIYSLRYKNDTINTKLHAYAYLKKAKIDGDSMRMAEAYHYIGASTRDYKLTLKYLDTSLSYSKNNEGFIVPASTYLTKSVIYSRNSNYKRALNNFLLAHEAAKRNNNQYYTSIAKYNIGVIKSRIGSHDEALEYAKESWSFHKDEKISNEYLWNLALLSGENTYVGNLEIGSDLNKKGIKESLIVNDTILYSMFVFLEGINLFERKQYSTAIDSIEKSLQTHINNKHTVYAAASYYYLGKSFYMNDQYEKAINNFKKVDSIFLNFDGLLPKCREAFKYLIDYAKQKKDLELQLYYTNQLLKFDNSLQNNYQYISSTIYKEHETPLLVEEKERVINKLKSNNNKYLYYIILSFILVSIIFIVLIFNNKKKKKYKQQFEKLMKLRNEQEEITKLHTKKNVHSIDIDKKIISTVLNKLEEFEKNQTFLEKKITLITLSEKIGVNSKYVSKIINTYKEKTVSQYVNSLRLNYCINRLESDSKFRKYALDHIASEVGFNTRRAFNTAFLKKTGISPSYFIENLKSYNSND